MLKDEGTQKAAPTSEFWTETELQLMDGEWLLYTGEPRTDAMRRANNLGSVIFISFIFPPALILLPLIFWLNRRSAERHKYFVTDRRVIVTYGTIGYQTRSVPLERVSDVQAGCSATERLFGLRHVVVTDNSTGGHARMLGVPDPQSLQELILERVRLENHTDASLERPAVPEAARQRSEMIELLGRIEERLAA